MRFSPFVLCTRNRLSNPRIFKSLHSPILRHRSTMAMHGHSEACCNVPPAKADYKEKGTYFDLKDGMKCYGTGPATANTAILIIFDIFGYKPQTMQGADMLAHSDDEHHQYQVFMPDLFRGHPAPLEIFPPDTPEKQKQLGDFFQGPAATDKIVPQVPRLIEELTARSNGTITGWGAVGYCWGGKIISLTSQANTAFKAVAECHPAMVDPADAKGISVPIAMLASGDEDKDAVAGFEKNLGVKHHVETFGDQLHGWMAARADLKDERVRHEYQRGYETLLKFFHEHL